MGDRVKVSGGSRRRSGFRRGFAILMIVALVMGACGVDDSGEPSSSGGSDTGSDTSGDGNGDEEPRAGGEITLGSAFLLSVDPTTSVPYGCCGGTGLVAVYDTLMDYDWDSQEYVGRTAENVESNDDYSEWTVTLRPGITFTDGTPYDAEAVKFNVERHMEQPRSQDFVSVQSFLDSVTVEDDLVVKFTLQNAWSGFPMLLSGPMGMIASPKSIEAAEGAGGEYGVDAAVAGAGPFTVKEFIPHESLKLERNPDYWSDAALLDRVNVIVVPTGTNPIDSIKAGSLHGIVTTDERYVAAAEKSGYPSLPMPLESGNAIVFNSGTYECSQGTPPGLCDGKEDGTKVEAQTPTSDPRVRRAVRHSIDPDRWNDRCHDGAGDMRDVMFPQFAPDVEGPGYDLDEAKRLVKEAKDDGWDGKIRFVSQQDPGQTTCQQTFITLMTAAGMDPELDLRPVSEYLQVVQIERDFDVAHIPVTQGEEDPFISLWRNIRDYKYGYDSPEAQKALDMIRVADSEAAFTEGYAALAEVLAEDVPVGIIGGDIWSFIHAPELRGVVATSRQNVRLDKAWLAN